jgi:hypothetical protein
MSRIFGRLAGGVVALTLLATMAVLPVAAATYTVTPGTFVGTADQCGGTPGTPGGVVARWDNSVGNPAPSIYLAKTAPTTDCSAAGIDVNGVSGGTVSELNFDFKGVCNGGSPRFDVVTTSGYTYFFGCNNVTPTDAGNGWQHVQFSPADAQSQLATNPPFTATTAVQSVQIVLDVQGSAYIDNVSVNNQVIGAPSTPTTAEGCKKGGWQHLQDANGNAFKNQGQCVSYFNHQNGRGDDDQGNND